jgi:hypothetical protein
MPSLSELQQAFARHLRGLPAAGLEGLVLSQGIEAADRLAVYRNNFSGALSGALKLAFPVVEKLVGEDFFRSAATRFACQSPPKLADLACYGAAFPAFLTNDPGLRDFPYVPEVAVLEWAVNEAYYAPEAKPLKPADLAGVAPEAYGDLLFVPHPSLRLVRSDFAIDRIWSAVKAEDAAAIEGLDPAGPAFVLLNREGFDVTLASVDQAAFEVTGRLAAGLPLAVALAEAGPEFPATELLADHLAHGRFAGARTGASPVSPPDASERKMAP